jgi:hypothetical protein
VGLVLCFEEFARFGPLLNAGPLISGGVEAFKPMAGALVARRRRFWGTPGRGVPRLFPGYSPLSPGGHFVSF